MQKWLRDDPNFAQKFWRALRAFWYNKWPSFLRPWVAFLWIWKLVVASSAPAIGHFVYETISLKQMAFATIALFALNGATPLFARLAEGKKVSDDNNERHMMMRVGELLGCVQQRKARTEDKDVAIKSALSVIEIYVRQVTGCKDGEISVSLATYVGSSIHKMEIRHRNIGNKRPTGRKFESVQILGHYACQSGREIRLVHDTKRLVPGGIKSPTQSGPTYRSIIFIPLFGQSGGGEAATGFISIDCTKPFAFYGNRVKMITIDCTKVFDHVQEMI